MHTEWMSCFLEYIRQKGFQGCHNIKEIIRVMKRRFQNETFFSMSVSLDTYYKIKILFL